jgi:hypothetical protein
MGERHQDPDHPSRRAGILGDTTSIPISARGRRRFGLVDPKGNEDLLYGYGPYLPAPSNSPAAVALEHCVVS